MCTEVEILPLGKASCSNVPDWSSRSRISKDRYQAVAAEFSCPRVRQLLQALTACMRTLHSRGRYCGNAEIREMLQEMMQLADSTGAWSLSSSTPTVCSHGVQKQQQHPVARAWPFQEFTQ